MKKNLLTFIGISILAITGLLFPLHPQDTFAVTDHVVISEIQIAGNSTENDFIELFNPTSSNINLGNMKLVRRTSTGSTDESIFAFTASDIIPAHGFYLWCNSSLEETLNCDRSSADNISNNNSVGLRYEPSDTGELIDSVTFGLPDYPFGEITYLSSPIALTSVERKANSTSTINSMAIGGIDEFLGNGEDTNNNSVDFVLRSIPQPQNSTSAIEPAIATPTPTNVPTPTPTVEPSPIPSPTTEPSPTVTPTNEPTSTPTISLTPTPTMDPSPTPIPTEEPSITPTLSPSLTPTITPRPNTPQSRIIATWPNYTCSLKYKAWKILNKTFFIPSLNCIRTSN